MMMNSQSIPRALIERVPLFMHLEDDTDAFTAESFREFICKDTQLFFLLCTQIKILKLALNYSSYFLKAQGCDIFGEKKKWNEKHWHHAVLQQCAKMLWTDWLIGLKPEWVPPTTKELWAYTFCVCWMITENDGDNWKLNNICNFPSTSCFPCLVLTKQYFLF